MWIINIRLKQVWNVSIQTCKVWTAYNYDTVGFSEIWANDNISDSELNIPGYSLYWKDRNNKCTMKGGGVVLYISDDLVCSHYDLLPKD